MKNDKIVAYIFLVLSLAAIYSYAQVNDKRFQNEEQNVLPRWIEQHVNKRGCRADGSRCTRDGQCCGISNCLRHNFGPFGMFRRYRCGRYGEGGSYDSVDLHRNRFGPARCGGDGHRCGRK